MGPVLIEIGGEVLRSYPFIPQLSLIGPNYRLAMSEDELLEDVVRH